jgi:hypothetical protein
MESIVEKRLSATGLGCWKAHFAAETFEDFGDRDADAGIKLVVQASNE